MGHTALSKHNPRAIVAIVTVLIAAIVASMMTMSGTPANAAAAKSAKKVFLKASPGTTFVGYKVIADGGAPITIDGTEATLPKGSLAPIAPSRSSGGPVKKGDLHIYVAYKGVKVIATVSRTVVATCLKRTVIYVATAKGVALPDAS